MFHKLQIDPEVVVEPQSALAVAEAELMTASRVCTETFQRCERLDAEQRYWLQRREQAMADHNVALARHAKAKERRERLAATLMPASGSVRSVVVAAGVVDGGTN